MTGDASEYGRLLAERDRLIADGADPAELLVPVPPTGPVPTSLNDSIRRARPTAHTPLGDLVAGRIDQAEYRRRMADLERQSWDELSFSDVYGDPGERCPVTDPFWCSRDRYHPGAHVNRSATGPGLIGWPNTTEPVGLDVRPAPDRSGMVVVWMAVCLGLVLLAIAVAGIIATLEGSQP